MLIEIACYSVEAALAAQNAGADRIELCSAPSVGGLTPGIGTILAARRYLSIPLNVMIRPREGDFCYTDLEFESILMDIESCDEAGVDGIVTGILLKDGTVDKERMKLVVEAAGPMKVTFHRAFDMVRNHFEALEALIDCGITTLLTSGGKQKAMQGIVLIADLVVRANKRIGIMPGSGINELNIKELINKTGVSEIHLSAKSYVPGAMQFKNPEISMGDYTKSNEYAVIMPDEGVIKRIREQFSKN
jgi:copper homeostasis protein